MISILKRIVTRSEFLNDPETPLLERVRPYTMASRAKLKNLKRLAHQVNADGIPGDFVECGTCKGGSSAVIASGLSVDRHLWLYDSFQGLPEASQKDGATAQEWA